MRALRKHGWLAVGLAAIAFSVWLLVDELRDLSLDELAGSLSAIPLSGWMLSALAALVAYVALAGYDGIALRHLGKSVSWLFIAVTSATAYALSHNIGASVISGAVVRYRAYASRGLSAAEVGVLVGFCSFTFALSVVLLTGLVLVLHPELTERLSDIVPVEASAATGVFLVALVGLYVLGSWRGMNPIRIGSFALHYPRLPIVFQQLTVGPFELLAAAAVLYFALPEAGNPGYVTVLGIFLVSFSAALISHAPGGLGVLELVFIAGLPEMSEADVLAALVVFRIFYLLVPFALGLVAIVLFEHSQLGWTGPPSRDDLKDIRAGRHTPTDEPSEP